MKKERYESDLFMEYFLKNKTNNEKKKKINREFIPKVIAAKKASIIENI